MKYDNILTKEFLQQEYLNKKRNINDISREIGCSRKTVKYYLDKFDISSRGNQKYNINKKDLENLYLKEKKSQRQIAKIFNCSQIVIQKNLKKFSIPIRTKEQGLDLIQPSDKSSFSGYKNLHGAYVGIVKYNAKRRNIIFNTTPKELWKLFEKQNGKCALTGLKLKFTSQHSNAKAQTASLDRIDSSKGYVKGNIQWVHKDVNKMKSVYTQARFMQICKLVANYDSVQNKT